MRQYVADAQVDTFGNNSTAGNSPAGVVTRALRKGRMDDATNSRPAVASSFPDATGHHYITRGERLRGAVADAGATLEAAQNFLQHQCIHFQKRRVRFIGPTLLGISLWALLATWVWQIGLIAVALLSTNIAFAGALRLAGKNQIERSLWLSLLAMLLSCLAVVLLVDGLGLAVMLAAVSIVVQTAVVSRRMALFGGIGIVGLLLVEQLLHNFGGYTRLQVPSGISLGITFVLGSMMVFQFLLYLSRHNEVIQATANRHAELSRKQADIIQTLGETMPFLEESVAQITGVSVEVASRATSQAEAMDAMATEVKTIMVSAEGTTAHARASDEISSEMQADMQQNVVRLQQMSQAFETALSNIHNARETMTNLVKNTDNIESILSYNRDIGEHIKVLSVNASIEAASAGEYGTGFAVVAQELREMIDSTEANLIQSRNLLDKIRRQSASGMKTIDDTAHVLESVFSELAATRQTLMNSTQSANDASQQLRQISKAALAQQVELSSMSTRVDMLLNSAFELAISSANLTDIVARLDDLKQTLAKSA